MQHELRGVLYRGFGVLGFWGFWGLGFGVWVGVGVGHAADLVFGRSGI